jgi:hypothetical protein
MTIYGSETLVDRSVAPRDILTLILECTNLWDHADAIKYWILRCRSYSGCYSSFHYCHKIPEITNLKRGKVHFGSQCWRAQSMMEWPHCFGTVAGQHIMVGTSGEAKLFISRPGSRRGRSWAPVIPLKGTLPSDLSPPTKSHLLQFLSPLRKIKL